MMQDTAAAETQAPSKTQELRDWLDKEIKKTKSDIKLLSTAIFEQECVDKGVRGFSARYSHLTSDEREAKMAEDRKKLEGLKKRLEPLRSARELDVDVDAIERVSGHRKVSFLQFLALGFVVCIKTSSRYRNDKSLTLYFSKRTLHVYNSEKDREWDLNFEDLQKVDTSCPGVVEFIFPGQIVILTSDDRIVTRPNHAN